MNPSLRTVKPLLVAGALVATAACDDVFGVSDQPSVTISFTTPAVPVSAARFALEPLTDPDGRVLVISSVDLVVERVRLERAEPFTCIGDDSSGVGSHDTCETFRVGPVLVPLPLDGGVMTPFQTPIPPGRYDELRLRVRKPGDDSTTLAFFAANPEWPRRAAVRVRGTFDRGDGSGVQSFESYIEADARFELDLIPVFVVPEGSDETFNLTVSIDVASWFRRADGRLVDPRDAQIGGPEARFVEDRIEESFEAFEDPDRRGRPDAQVALTYEPCKTTTTNAPGSVCLSSVTAPVARVNSARPS